MTTGLSLRVTLSHGLACCGRAGRSVAALSGCQRDQPVPQRPAGRTSLAYPAVLEVWASRARTARRHADGEHTCS
jgi:hypothetical protein